MFSDVAMLTNTLITRPSLLQEAIRTEGFPLTLSPDVFALGDTDVIGRLGDVTIAFTARLQRSADPASRFAFTLRMGVEQREAVAQAAAMTAACMAALAYGRASGGVMLDHERQPTTSFDTFRDALVAQYRSLTGPPPPDPVPPEDEVIRISVRRVA